MHQSTKQNLPVIAAGLLVGRSFGSIGRELGITGRAVSLAAKKWLPDVYAMAGSEPGGAGKIRAPYRRAA